MYSVIPFYASSSRFKLLNSGTEDEAQRLLRLPLREIPAQFAWEALDNYFWYKAGTACTKGGPELKVPFSYASDSLLRRRGLCTRFFKNWRLIMNLASSFAQKIFKADPVLECNSNIRFLD